MNENPQVTKVISVDLSKIPPVQTIPSEEGENRKRKLDDTDFDQEVHNERPRRKRKSVTNPDFLKFHETELKNLPSLPEKPKKRKRRDSDEEYSYNPNEEFEDDFRVRGLEKKKIMTRNPEDAFMEPVDYDYVQEVEEESDSDEGIQLEEEELELRTDLELPKLDLKERKGYSLRDPKPKKKTPEMKRARDKHKKKYSKLRKQHREYNRRLKEGQMIPGNIPLHDTTSSSDDDDDDDDDDEMFVKPKRGRPVISKIQSTYTKIAPLNRGVENYRMGRKKERADIDPVPIDKSITFESIGGLKNHVKSLKEMIILPLMYPEVYTTLSITPPRGVLFVGPPGTGKTLMARALANQCRVDESQEIAFFMRKGADILSKWVGEAEKQLRLLFERAREMQPSIIFFDEIDGLAPVRSSKQDYIHSSIVSTLLALMDGLDDRGQVVVIGATNRVDSIDPALRRPGRFDRELYFDLPNVEDREEILKIHTSKWQPSLPLNLIKELAKKTVGYCGADIQNLCTESALSALRRRYPQIYESNEKLQIEPETIIVEREDWMKALGSITPSSYKVEVFHPAPLPLYLEPLLRKDLENLKKITKKIFPFSSKLRETSVLTFRPWILIEGNRGMGQNYLTKALIHESLEHLKVFNVSLSNLLVETKISSEEALVSILNNAKNFAPSVILLPEICNWWENSSSLLRHVFISALRSFPSNLPLLVIITSSRSLSEIPKEVLELVRTNTYPLKLNSFNERKKFFESLYKRVISPVPKKAPVRQQYPQLPKAKPKVQSVEDVEKMERKTRKKNMEIMLEFKIYLYQITMTLINNRSFTYFKMPKSNRYEFIDDSDMNKPKKLLYLFDILSKVNKLFYRSTDMYLSDAKIIAENAKLYKYEYCEDEELEKKMHSLGQQFYDTVKLHLKRSIPKELKEKVKEMNRKLKEEQLLKTNASKEPKLQVDIPTEIELPKPTKSPALKLVPPSSSTVRKEPVTTPLIISLRPRRKKKQIVDAEFDKPELDNFFQLLLKQSENMVVEQLERIYCALDRVVNSYEGKSNRYDIVEKFQKALK